MNTKLTAYNSPPDRMLMNGKCSYLDPLAKTHESFAVTQGTNGKFSFGPIMSSNGDTSMSY